MRWPGTWSCAAISLAVFVVDVASQHALTAWGAKTAAIWSGEFYRLVTATFLHADLRHLLFNMYALYVFGRLVEPLVGSIRFLLIYVLSGAIGYVFSLFARPAIPAVGASAAIFGLIGYTIHFRLRRLPRVFLAIDKGLVQVLGLNLIFGLLMPRVDQMAHLGGLVGGMLAGSLLGLPTRGPIEGGKVKDLGERVLALVPIVLMGLVVWQPSSVIAHLDSFSPAVASRFEHRFGPFLAPLWADSIVLMSIDANDSQWRPVPDNVRVLKGTSVAMSVFWRWERGRSEIRPVPYAVLWRRTDSGVVRADEGVAKEPDRDTTLIHGRSSILAGPGQWHVSVTVDGRSVWERRIEIVSKGP